MTRNRKIIQFIILILASLVIYKVSIALNNKQEINYSSPTSASQQEKNFSSSSLSLPNKNHSKDSPEAQTFLVARVVDGDTIELDNGQKVRYIGVDTPETKHPKKPVQCFGVEAYKKNIELVAGKRVRLEKDVSETDKYGRLLRYAYVGDTFVNLELAKQGYAYAATFPPDVKYQNIFRQAQTEAREAGRGLWGACPAKVY